MSAILPLTPGHSLAVAALHMSYLSTSFNGAAGQRLLACYYKTVSAGQGAVGYVAEDQDQVLGYVCGVWAPAEARSILLKSRWPELLIWGLASVLLQPRIAVSFVQRFGSPDDKAGAAETGYELRPIVVDPAARGTGVAARLVERLVLDARQRGFDRMHLYTETDNEPAKAFYRKMGFQNTGEIQRHDAHYVRFERSVLDAS